MRAFLNRVWQSIRFICGKPMKVEIESRHGAFRTRVHQFWVGKLLFVEIPLQKKHGVTDTPMGRISSGEAKKLIDAFTGVEGEDPLQEIRPGSDPFDRILGSTPREKVCPFCGKTQ